MTTATSTPGQSFLRRRSTRVALGLASVAGFTLLGTAPALAAEASDCTAGNTVDAGAGGTRADIQTLLDADTAVICLSGTFDVDVTLFADYGVTLFGLSNAVLDGGGTDQIFYNSTSDTTTVQNITFQNGYVDGNGGAINAYAVVAIDSTFIDNEADDDGGAIYSYATISQGSTFEGNIGDFGGAIYGETSVEAENSTFVGNEGQYGGAIFTYGVATATASTFADNGAQSGGAILGDDEVQIENSTFVSNSAGNGGAVLGGSGQVIQSTFLENGAADSESVYVWDGNIDVRGNIFAGSAGGVAQVGGDDDDTITDLGGNIFTTSAATESELTDVQASTLFEISTALIFDGATLADNGGPTQTVALYAQSPAVDAVPAGSPSVTVDQRGVARDAVSDAGAYEFVAAIAPDKPALAATGSSVSGWAAGAAGALLAAGAVAIAAVRRRRA